MKKQARARIPRAECACKRAVMNAHVRVRCRIWMHVRCCECTPGVSRGVIALSWRQVCVYVASKPLRRYQSKRKINVLLRILRLSKHSVHFANSSSLLRDRCNSAGCGSNSNAMPESLGKVHTFRGWGVRWRRLRYTSATQHDCKNWKRCGKKNVVLKYSEISCKFSRKFSRRKRTEKGRREENEEHKF